MIFPLIIIGKLIYLISNIFNLGSGGTWPGEIALRVKPDILKEFSSKLSKGCILVVGTNGKTTTSLMIKKILVSCGNKVIHNGSGANLLNGVVSSFIQYASWNGQIKADWGVFEVDENALPIVLKDFDNYSSSDPPAGGESRSLFGKSSRRSLPRAKSRGSNNKELIIVFLNLFRDQLDRYGEVDVIAEKWSKALKELSKETKIILNADDPLIAYLGKAVISRPGLEAGISYFGLEDPKLFQKKMEHATDSIFCLNCGNRLSFDGVYYSHLGIWHCKKCGEKRPKPDITNWPSNLAGVYNQYNTLAAVSLAKTLGVPNDLIKKTLSSFSPAFGRQEEFIINGKKVKIFLSKNPAGYNETLRTVISIGAKKLLFVLNDRIPDGRDVSWIWDVDFEMIPDNVSVIVSGDRTFDSGLRIKYAKQNKNEEIKNKNDSEKLKIYEKLEDAIKTGLENIGSGEILYILPTYSAMLEVRKILKGRKIL